eukprot:g6150.t1
MLLICNRLVFSFYIASVSPPSSALSDLFSLPGVQYLSMGARASKTAQELLEGGLDLSDSNKVGQLLQSVPILSTLSQEERSKLASLLKMVKFKQGDILFKAGQDGDSFYIIREGEVAVANAEGQEVARLKPGDYFGEAALLAPGTKRNATISASQPLTCYVLDQASFAEIFVQKKAKVKFAKRAAVANDTRDRKIVPPADASKEKDNKVRAFLENATKKNVLFQGLEPEQRSAILNEMYKTTLKKGTSPIKQGDHGDNLYVVASGKFDVIKDGKKVFEQLPGTAFGELALMYNAPRAATVTAAEDSLVWVVDRYTFRRVVNDLSQHKFAAYVEFLSKVEMLVPLASWEREKIAEALEEVSFGPGERIFDQGDHGDAIVLVTKDGAEVARCSEGKAFGERALLKDEPRAASVCAGSGDVTLLKLDRTSFALLLGPLEDIMKREVAEKYDVGGKPSSPKPAAQVKQGYGQIKFEDLELIGTLGKGAFGHVQLVKGKKDHRTYALKTVSKALIVETGQQGHILSEKKTMEVLKHPFIIELCGTFKDHSRLFFLLEPCLGGDLFSVLREKTLFDEDASRFYSSCVISAFEYMHSKNIIYRDLKPENLLIDKEGYLKVTDFGFAKNISAGRTWTLCGTPDYLAPEIVGGKGHGKGVDWWTVGVFIYEMLASYAPFYDEDPMKTYQKIVNGDITFPSHFSKDATSLVKKLLHRKPIRRLGVTKGGATLIKKHPWFKSHDWDALLEKKLSPPMVPVIKSDVDMSNIEEYEEGAVEPFPPEVDPYQDDGSNWDEDF